MKTSNLSNLGRAATRGAASLILTILLLAALPVTQVYAADGAVTTTVATQSGTVTYGTAGTADFLITVSQAGKTTPSITLSVTGLPSGTSVTWSTNPVVGTRAPGVTTTLHITTTGGHGGTPAGTFSFLVHNSSDINTGTGSFTVARKALAVAATGVDKVYDGTPTATVTLSDDRLTGDILTAGYASATFADKNFGTGKSITVSGITVSTIDDGNNYTPNTTAMTTASIGKRALMVTATGDNKIYDGTMDGTVSLGDNRVAGDSLTLGYTSAIFASKNVNTGIGVSVTGITVGGTDAGNYTYNTTASTSANITQRALLISATGVDKPYDGTPDTTVTLATNKLAGDDVTPHYTSAAFVSKNVNPGVVINVSGLSITGTDAGNYSHNISTSTSATISKRALTVTATGVNKTYDGTTDAAVTLDTNKLPGDDVTPGYTSAAFANKSADTGVAISVSGISLGGGDAGNYSHNTTASTAADIAPRTLVVTATGIDKTYDGTLDATVTLGDDRVSGDTLTLDYTSAAFADKKANSGVAISVSGISISGDDAGNYTHNTTASASANIGQRALTVSATGIDKTYDGTTDATVTLGTNKLAADVVTAGYASATFADKNANTGVGITVSGISISGDDADNYTYNTSASTSADIGQRALAVTATGVNKTYDGTATATVTLQDDRVSGDDVTPSYSAASFADANAGIGIAVSVSGISLSGTDAANYTYNTGTSTAADIEKAHATIHVSSYSVTYNGAAHTATGTADGVEVSAADLSSLLDLSGTTHTNAGTYNGDAWSFAGNGNYFSETGTVDDNIDKATPILSVSNSPATYDALTHAATVSGSVGGDVTNVLMDGAATQTNAGTYAVTADFAPADTVNYESLTGASAGSFTIEKATPTLHVTNSPITYDGLPHAATVAGSVAGVPANVLTGGAETQTDLGTYPVTADFTPDDTANYNSLSGAAAGEFLIGQPVFQANPASGAYALIKVGTTSAAKVFTITNTGNVNLTVSSVALTGTNANQFAITTGIPCSAPVPPTGTCSVAVVFRPTATGSKTASLSFTDNAGNHAIALSGKAGVQATINGGLDYYPTLASRVPTGWVATNFSATDGKSTSIKKAGAASVRMSNTTAVLKTLTQTRNLSGAAGDAFLFSVWAKGQNIAAKGVMAQVMLYNGTTLVQRKTIALPAGTYGFTPGKLTFTATGAYTRIVIKLSYSKGGGSVWFDNVNLLRAH